MKMQVLSREYSNRKSYKRISRITKTYGVL